MISYIYLKKYDSSFGDIVPYMMANVLSVNVYIIVELSKGAYFVHSANMTDERGTFNIYLFKRGAHYDACIPICQRSQNEK